jgi:hypothetical protein
MRTAEWGFTPCSPARDWQYPTPAPSTARDPVPVRGGKYYGRSSRSDCMKLLRFEHFFNV